MTQNADIQNRITGDGPLIPVIFRLAGPVVLMMYLQNAYNIIDTIWVGQLLGDVALAGIATGGYLLWMLFGLTNLVSVGVAAIIARRMGEGKVREAERSAALGLGFSLVVSLVVAVVMWLALPTFFDMMGTDPQVTKEGMIYIKVLLVGAPLIFISFTIQQVFQAAGDTVSPMWLMAVSLAMNLVLDPVLMIGLGPFPKMGIAGAAVATVISRLMMVMVGLCLLGRGQRLSRGRINFPILARFGRVWPSPTEGYLHLQGKETGYWDWPLFGRILRIGLPTSISMAMFPFVYMVLVRIPAEYGPSQIAALRIGHTVEGMSFFLALGFSIATATCVGQNLGAGKPIRARNAALVSTAIMAVTLLVFSVCFRFFSYQISSVFSPDPVTIAAGATYLKILAWSQVFMGVEIVLGGAFSGAGDTMPPMAVAVPLNLLRIPLGYFLSGTLGWGVVGVWWAISGTSILKGLVLAAWFARGKWVEKAL